MIENVLDFFLLSLASFRMTRLIVFDSITEFFRAPFFEEEEEINKQGETEIYIVPKKNGIRGFIGRLLSCYWCTGIWVSMIFYGLYLFIPGFFGPVLVVLAVAGLAALIETAVHHMIQE
ncbi:sporulation protein [Bacillus sp. M6-12]|uniref:DUF1360 domain-containing protein n=1 Tax=Bacillus sp. M6-12 TaxID=2054166 RepID=UPI000C783062|nr:DUF1360 domain-containing protein [Bacillus sp. M6-12]PLS16004.1 sporulation protein [Bacillus sp. M6-12]